MHGERVQQRRAQADDALEEVRAADGQQAGHRAAAALPDDHRGAPVTLDELLELTLEPLDRPGRAVHVDPHPCARRPVAQVAQPARHRRQRRVARQEAGHEQDRPAVAARHALAAQDGVAQQRKPLGRDPAFPPDRDLPGRDGGERRHGASIYPIGGALYRPVRIPTFGRSNVRSAGSRLRLPSTQDPNT
jgi:hypothetical protein